MDKSDQRETHDFMNVESFSQLPFIRPAPVKEKGGGAGGIRLFGKDFGGGGGGDPLATDDSESVDTNACGGAGDNDSSLKDNNNNNNDGGGGGGGNGSSGGESSRRFECHYCCRNFPTSQALGGHQNAHKRERQHAKRAHLQSAMVHGGSGAVGGGLSDSHHHVYGLINYHRFGSSPAAAAAYPTWNAATSSSGGRFYGGHIGSYSPAVPPTINGSPLGLWRIPAAVHQGGDGTNPSAGVFGGRGSVHGSSVLPLFSGDDMKVSATAVALGGPGGGGQRGFVYHDSKSATVQEHVSLDLHL